MHWHAYAYTGPSRPGDQAARDLTQAVPPNEISHWFRKPQSLRAATFTDPDTAYDWLESELMAAAPSATALPAASHLVQAQDCLRRQADAYVGYYTAQGARFLVRALLTCPRSDEPCPEPPPAV